MGDMLKYVVQRWCRFLKAGASGSAERAQIVAEIEAKEEVTCGNHLVSAVGCGGCRQLVQPP